MFRLNTISDSVGPTEVADRLVRERVSAEIEEKLAARGSSLANTIRERELYFRVSLVGTCNLSCAFCHNEGAPKTGKITLDVVGRAVDAAARVGFNRVQFTGGEPLLRPDVAEFVARARRSLSDVGVTTNGVLLPQRLDALLASGIRRVHVSLQLEPLLEASPDGVRWGIPPWLEPTVAAASGGAFSLRLNLPVPADAMAQTEDFLRDLTAKGIGVKVFALLPKTNEDNYPLGALQAVVERVNTANRQTGVTGEVLLRGYRPPGGIRCPKCKVRVQCKEQSHSLRLGADLVLRPCLASREWDTPLDLDALEPSIRNAAILALDYQ